MSGNCWNNLLRSPSKLIEQTNVNLLKNKQLHDKLYMKVNYLNSVLFQVWRILDNDKLIDMNPKNMEKMRTGKIALGVVSGIVAGAAIGMLFAPKKGADTRQRIADRSNEYVNGTRTRINELMNDVSHKFDSVKNKAMGKKREMHAHMDGDEKIIY